MQENDDVSQKDKVSNNSFYEFGSDRFEQLASAAQAKLYQSMESCALSQLILFTTHSELLNSLKLLVEKIERETDSYLRTQEYNDGRTYLKIISLIDKLEVIDYLGRPLIERNSVNRKLQKNIASWRVPRHLVIQIIEDFTAKEHASIAKSHPELVSLIHYFSSLYKHDRNTLVTANFKLVFSIAGRYRFLGLPYHDLVQEGSIGLLKAIERFDPSKGFLFSTYAYTAVSHHIHTAIEKQSSVVRKPYEQLRDKAVADKTRARLEQQLLRPPRSREFEANLPSSIDNKRPYVELNTHATARLDPYQQSPEPEEHELMGKHDQDIKTQVLVYQRDLHNILSKLDLRKQTILRMRYGIGINRTYTLKEISDVVYISGERVRQLSVLAEKELQSLLQEELIIDNDSKH